jgi:hypothetical protein
MIDIVSTKANSSRKRNAQISGADEAPWLQAKPIKTTFRNDFAQSIQNYRSADWRTVWELTNELGIRILILLLLIPKIVVDSLLGIICHLHDLLDRTCGSDWKTLQRDLSQCERLVERQRSCGSPKDRSTVYTELQTEGTCLGVCTRECALRANTQGSGSIPDDDSRRYSERPRSSGQEKDRNEKRRRRPRGRKSRRKILLSTLDTQSCLNHELLTTKEEITLDTDTRSDLKSNTSTLSILEQTRETP